MTPTSLKVSENCTKKHHMVRYIETELAY